MQVVVFKLNDQEFAFHIQSVKEIIKITAITHVPNAQESVQGIINLRGMVTPIINLAERLALRRSPLPSIPESLFLIFSKVRLGLSSIAFPKS